MPEGKIDPSLESSLPVNGTGNPSELSAVRRMREVFDRPQTRRNFLRMLGGAGASAIGFRPDGALASQTDQESHATPVVSEDHTDVSPQGPDQSHQGADASHESEHHGISKVNLATAEVNVGNFGLELGMILFGKKHGFDKGTAIRNTAFASARVGTLSVLDREAMDHDLKEFKGSYPLVPVLVALAEGASNMKVANDEIYKDHSKMKAFIEEIAIGGDSRIVASDSLRKLNGRKTNGQSEDAGEETQRLEEDDSTHIYPQEQEKGQESVIDFDDLDVTQDLEAWEGYLELVQQDVIDSLSQNAATTAIFAPLTTTYSSSAIADENHKNIYKQVARLRYVKEVIDVKRHQVSRKSSEYIDRNQVEQLQQDAQEKALEIMNGFGGFNHLSLTLATNANGMALIGDPPMLFYLSRHGVEEFVELSAKGFAVSEVSELMLTYAFLKRAGVNVKIPEYTASFFANQGKTLRKIGQSLTDGALRDVSFNGGRKASREVTRLLEALDKEGVSEDVRNELISKMHETPEPSIFVDPRTLVKNKLERLEKMKLVRKTKETVGNLTNTDTTTLSDEVVQYMKMFESGEFEDYVNYFASEDYRSLVENDEKGSIKAVLKAMQMIGANSESSKLTALLESLIIHTHPENEEVSRAEEGDSTVPPVNVVMDSLATIDARVAGKPDVNQLFSDLMSITPEEFEQYEEDLKSRQGDEGDVAMQEDQQGLSEEKAEKIKGIYDSFRMLDNEDVRSALEDALLLAEKEEYVHEDDEMLSESAKEVLFALTSQLPVVPSWVVVSEDLLERTMGAKDGELTRQAVLNQISVLLGEGAAFSATADNVAAYLFVETVMEKIMIDYYGEEFYRSNHELQEIAWTSSAMIAMVAGANSKYGNGPNLLKHEYDKDLNKDHISLGTSFRNPYAIVQTVLTGVALRNRIAANMPEKETA